MNQNFQVSSLQYLIHITEKTAKITGNNDASGGILIPSFILHESYKHFFTSISEDAIKNSHKIKSFYFSIDSKVHTINSYAINSSSIEYIPIPSSLVELKGKWCADTPNISMIKVDSKNPHYSIDEEKFIIAKSSPEKENFDILVFSVRNIETATIPNFIEIISSYFFSD